MCDLAREGSPKAEITLPKARRPLLMEIPSLIRSPAAAVRFSCANGTPVSFDVHKRIKDADPFGPGKINEMEL